MPRIGQRDFNCANSPDITSQMAGHILTGHGALTDILIILGACIPSQTRPNVVAALEF